MAASDATLAAAFQNGMDSNQLVVFQDTDLAGQRVHLNNPAAGAVGDRVQIAANRHHAVAGDPPVECQDDGERHRRQRLQGRLLLDEVLQHDAAGGGVPARIGDGVEPAPELGVQIIEVAE
jgi:hypothetical protein